MASQIYRGYDIEYSKEKGWRVSLNGEFLCAQPSEEFACSWVNKDRLARTHERLVNQKGKK